MVSELKEAFELYLSLGDDPNDKKFFKHYMELGLSRKEIRAKYIRYFKNEPPLLDSHIRKLKSKSVDVVPVELDKIRELLNVKDIDPRTINSYIGKLTRANSKELPHLSPFKFKGYPITVNKLKKEKFTIRDISHVESVSKEMLEFNISELEKDYPNSANIAILKTYVERLDAPEDAKSGDYFVDIAIGRFDLALTERRKEIYEYWEGIYEKFDDVLVAAQAVIDEYETSNKDYHEYSASFGSGPKTFKTAFTELYGDEDNKQKMNYVVKFDAEEIDVPELHGGRIHELGNVWYKTLVSIAEEMESTVGGYRREGDTSVGESEGMQEAWSDAEEAWNEASEREQEGITGLMKSKLWVDPLLAYLIDNNKLKYGAYSKEEVEFALEPGIKHKIRQLKRLFEEFEDDSIVDTISDYFNEIKAQASHVSGLAVVNEDGSVKMRESLESVKRRETDKEAEIIMEEITHLFYLPLTQEVIDAANVVPYFADDKESSKLEDADDIMNHHNNFLRGVFDLLSPDEAILQSRGTVMQTTQDVYSGGSKDRGGRKDVQEPVGVTMGHKGVLKLPKKGPMKTKLNKLIKAIQEYYVYPNDSQLSPFDGQLLVLNSEYGKKLLLGLAVEAADNRTMDTIRAKTTEYGIFIFDHHDINDIAAYLEEKQKFNNYADLETKSIDAFNAIEDVLTEKHTRENKIYFGYWLAIFSEKNGEGISGKTFQGLSLSVAKDEYDNSKQYPIKDLNTTIIDRKLELKKREE